MMSPAASSPDVSSSKSSEASTSSPTSYVVVARRYRPKSFRDLVGQDHITRALSNAITTNRVGHAYMFTGARGVGKTSTARIFAKALNAPGGSTPDPDNESDICQAIDAGEDVDVIEIDGASNRGIDEIRQLRANASIRPSRSRFKIYIIDEVHMLTTAAFNALLKTLEEPPGHVKFILCTTDPQKVPITVLSRCQRYDFAPIDLESIVDRLQLIVDTEGCKAEPEALRLLARRAEGSVRDSQSLLEQLLAYSADTIRVSDVHRMLGTAATGQLATLTGHLIQRDAAEALKMLDRAVVEGVDCGQLAEQLLGYLRDMMMLSVGCTPDLLRHTGPSEHESLAAAAEQLGLATILATQQILDQAVVRMRQTTQPRLLLEIAIVRICDLENLDQLASLIDQFRDGPTAAVPSRASRPPAQSGNSGRGKHRPVGNAGAPEKKTDERAELPLTKPTADTKSVSLTSESAESLWKQAIGQIEDMTADYASYCERVATSAPNCLVVFFRQAYTLQKEACDQPERKKKLELALSQVAGATIRIQFATIPDDPVPASAAVPTKSPLQLRRDKESDPWVREAIEVLGAEVTRVDIPRKVVAAPESSGPSSGG